MTKKIIYQVFVIFLPYLFFVLFGGREAYITFLTLLFLIYSLTINNEKQSIIYIWVLFPVSLYILLKMSNGFASKNIQNPIMWKNFSMYFVLMLAGYLTGFFISKCKTRIFYSLTLLVSITYMLGLLGRIAFLNFCFVTDGIIYFVAPYIAWRYISKKPYIPLIFIVPNLLMDIEGWLRGTIIHAFALIPLFAILIYYIALLLKEKRSVQIVLSGIYAMFLIYGWYRGIDDSREWIYVQRARLPQNTYAEYNFYDVAGLTVVSTEHTGKVVVLDFWTTSCGVCFRDFPEFERVYQKYKQREDIVFFAVNLPLKNDTRETIMKSISKHVNYSFQVLLAGENSDYWTQFKIGGVPHLTILDKTGKVVFNGGANYEKKSAYNIENIIDKLLVRPDLLLRVNDLGEGRREVSYCRCPEGLIWNSDLGICHFPPLEPQE